MSAAGLQKRNRERAEAARIALAAYCRHTSDDDGVEGLTDLIADCGHLASELEADFVRVVTCALRHWSAEQHYPDGLEAASAPHFTITRTPRTKGQKS